MNPCTGAIGAAGSEPPPQKKSRATAAWTLSDTGAPKSEGRGGGERTHLLLPSLSFPPKHRANRTTYS